MLVPASRAAVKCARCSGDQYSSWPSESTADAPSSSRFSRATSVVVAYARGIPSRSASATRGAS